MEREICYVEMNRGSVNILSRKVAFYVEKQRGSPNVSTIILKCIFNLKVLPVLIHNLTCSHSYINAQLLLLFIYQLTIYMLIAF